MPADASLNGIALTPEEAELKAAVRSLAERLFAPGAEQVDRDAAFPTANVQALREAGLLNASVPKRFGGRGASILATAVMTEEAGRACASTAMVLAMHYSVLPVLFMKASPAQADGLLAPIAQGRSLTAIAASEVGSGTRLWHMDGHADDRGDHVLITAAKSFVTASGHADHLLVPVRTSPAAGRDDLDMYLVPRDTPGVSRLGTWDAMGMRGNDSRPIRFDQVRLPAGHRIGGAGDAYGYLLAANMPHYLVTMSAAYLGIAQGAMDAAVAHATARKHSDTALSMAHIETIQRYVGTMKGQVDQMRCSLYHHARLVGRAIPVFDELAEAGLLDRTLKKRTDDPFFAELLSMKAGICETARATVDLALQVAGGRGYKRGTPIERAYRDVRAGSVMAPSDDIAKLVAGRQLLGVPQPWA